MEHYKPSGVRKYYKNQLCSKLPDVSSDEVICDGQSKQKFEGIMLNKHTHTHTYIHIYIYT